MHLAIRQIEGPYGTVSYRLSDAPGETALFFVHGAAGDSRLFHGQLKHFGQTWKTVAVDLPGHGKSTGIGEPGMADYTAAVRDIRDREGLGSCVLVGHSMGGCVCMDLYASDPSWIRALVLVSTGPTLPVTGEMLEVLNRDIDEFVRLIISSVFSKNVGVVVELFKRGLVDGKAALVRNDLFVSRDLDYTGVLRHIAVPVLVLANRGDRVVRAAHSAAMAGAIPGANYVEFALDGHVPFFEHKELFNTTLEGFLRQAGISPGGA